MQKIKQTFSASHEIPIIVSIILIVALGFFVYEFFLLRSQVDHLQNDLSLTKSTLEQNQSNLRRTEQEAIELANRLQDEKDRNDDFENQINELTGTLGNLDKLSKLDEELLQKYSKIYFLNEHYTPPSLRTIKAKYVYGEDEERINSSVYPYLDDLLDAAKDDDINLEIISAYRSFGEQASLKAGYTVSYGSGANTFSADQGYSEHQLGTTVDFTTKELAAGYSSFDQTEAYKWLLDNAYRYGFVLSYPKGNSYYIFEPWHWRFVGKDLARYLDRNNFNFYDVDQRKIDEYLIEIFD